MATSEYGLLLEQLGRILEIPELKPDENESCLIRIEGTYDIYVEPDEDSDYLIIGIDFGVLPLGRYRDDLLEAALKTNSLKPPLNGVLAYSQQADHFVMFDRLWMRNLSGEQLADHIKKFAAKAKVWKEAIENNTIPVISEVTTSDHVGIFGLKP